MNQNPINKREMCLGCQKCILYHHKIMSCHDCKTIYHGICSKTILKFSHSTGKWICLQCLSNKKPVYNPFDNIGYDKHDPFNMVECDDINTISEILKSCQTHDRASFNSIISNPVNTGKDTMSITFNNIDRNASNFDAFITDLSQYKHKFSVIGIAETNIDECNKNLYNILGYNFEYSSKLANKSKGSGLGIYVIDKFQFTKLDKFCNCSPNLETLFIEVTNTVKPITIGITYRPPSGDKLLFNKEVDALLQNLPKENLIIAGDFNINLFSSLASEFEEMMFSNNLIPTVSQATHERPGCKPSLIDNILINSTENHILSGVLQSRVSHHFPIFNVFTCPLPSLKCSSQF